MGPHPQARVGATTGRVASEVARAAGTEAQRSKIHGRGQALEPRRVCGHLMYLLQKCCHSDSPLGKWRRRIPAFKSFLKHRCEGSIPGLRAGFAAVPQPGEGHVAGPCEVSGQRASRVPPTGPQRPLGERRCARSWPSFATDKGSQS